MIADRTARSVAARSNGAGPETVRAVVGHLTETLAWSGGELEGSVSDLFADSDIDYQDARGVLDALAVATPLKIGDGERIDVVAHGREVGGVARPAEWTIRRQEAPLSWGVGR